MLCYVISCCTFLEKFHSEKIKTNINDNPALVLIATGSNNTGKINKIITHLISRLILIGRNCLMWTYYTIATEHNKWTELAGCRLVGCTSTAQEFNQGFHGTNPVDGQSGTWTQGQQISSPGFLLLMMFIFLYLLTQPGRITRTKKSLTKWIPLIILHLLQITPLYWVYSKE